MIASAASCSEIPLHLQFARKSSIQSVSFSLSLISATSNMALNPDDAKRRRLALR